MKIAAALVIYLCVAGCVPSQPRGTNLSPAYLRLSPSTSSYQDPDASLTGYHTFSVFPASVLGVTAAANEIVEKQILFFLRNALEAKGYRFVELDQQPDFLATLALAAEYRESQIAPSTAVVPIWIPGRTVTSQSSTSGGFSYNTYGSYSSRGWGTYNGQTTTTTFVPGRVETQVVTRPGYTVGHYYPMTHVAIVDGKSLKAVWIGSGVGTSDNADARISGQFVVASVLDRFSNAPATASRSASPGYIGLGFQILTADGNNYLPTVTNLLKNGPAANAGLRAEDMVVSIDGRPTVNVPFAKVLQMLAGDPGSNTRLEIWRAGRQIVMTVPRVPRP